ncbi:MAG: hypothetical protein ACK5MK_13990 [Dysgonomonas sp.]
MRKIYYVSMCLCTLLLSTVTALGQTTKAKKNFQFNNARTLTLYDLEVIDSNTGLIYEDDFFKVTGTNTTNLVLSGNPPYYYDCLFPNDDSRTSVKYLGMHNSSVNGSVIGGSSTVDIEFKLSPSVGELVGMYIYGFTESSYRPEVRVLLGPNTINAANYYEGFYLNGSDMLEHSIQLPQSEVSACNVVDAYTSVPDTIVDGEVSGEEYVNMRRTIDKFRISWTPAKQTPAIGNPELIGIKILYNIDSSVGIESDAPASFRLAQNGSELSFNEAANVEVYSLSGILVATGRATSLVSLAPMSRGIYIVKAQSVLNGNNLIQKIAYLP